MTTISRKTWDATENKWKLIDYDTWGGGFHYFLMLAGKFREVALVD